jgi:exopolysaccharide biosynthesis polyprenyl glycosylphosphotransferase
MTRRHGPTLRALLMASDALVAAALLVVVHHMHLEADEWLSYPLWAVAAVCAATWVGLLYLHGAYRLRAHLTVMGEVRAVVRAVFLLAFLGLGAILVSGMDAAGRASIVLFLPALALATVSVRVALRLVMGWVRRHGHDVRNLVILGTGPAATEFARFVETNQILGVRVTAFLGDEPPDGPRSALHRGGFDELPRILREEVVDEVAVCVAPTEWQRVEPYVELCHAEDKLVRVPLKVPRLDTSRRFLENLDGTAVLSFSNGPDELAAHALKRVFDLAVACLALVVAGPFMLAIAAALRVRQGPGVLFRQTRVGLHGRPFTIYKFRTMVPEAEALYAELADRSETRGAAFKLLDDPRVTGVGRFLRRYSLDELPQLLNVVRGEMSIVGPRPAPPREVQAYDLWHRRRLSVKPGITGLWQVTQRLDRDFDERAELDLRYIEGWSIWLDMSIIFRTLPAIFRRPGH